MINNASSHNDKHSQLLSSDVSQLRRPPLSSVSSGSMNGCQVTEGAVASKSVLSCSASALPDKSLSDRDIDMRRAVRHPGRKRRGPLRRLTESVLSRLIAEVIDNQPEKKALVQDIYRGLQQREPDFFSIRGKGSWQGRVRRLLSRRNQLFVKTPERGPGGDNRFNTGYYWQLQPGQATSLRVQQQPSVCQQTAGPRE